MISKKIILFAFLSSSSLSAMANCDLLIDQATALLASAQATTIVEMELHVTQVEDLINQGIDLCNSDNIEEGTKQLKSAIDFLKEGD